MRKDINFLPVEGVQVVVARKLNQEQVYDWQVYLINQNNVPISNVFVTSKGYGRIQEEKEELTKTSTLRHFFAGLQPGENQVVETIMPDVFHLNNEYWVSYFINNQVYDKKFIFVPDSITEQHLVKIPALGLEGVLHA